MKSTAITLAFGLLFFSCVYTQTQTLCPEYTATPAITDYTVANTSGGHVLYLFGSSLTAGLQQFTFNGDEGLLTFNGSSATLTGSLIELGGGSASNGFSLTLQLTSAPATAGVVEVSPASLVSPATWSFYNVDPSSSLVGFGSFSGVTLSLTQQTSQMPFQIGYGASGKNLLFGAAVWLNIVSNNTLISADININLNCSNTPICPGGNNMSATPALDDLYALDGSGGAFTFFEPPSGLTNGWVFANDSGILSFDGNTLRLTGTIVPLLGSHASLTVDISFVATAAPASPHFELSPSAYVSNGGPINPSLWTFYNFALSTSTISGDGISLTITQQMDTMPFQVGFGASGKNIQFGASAWFTWTFEGQSGSGDININLNCLNSTVAPPPPPPSDCSVTLSAALRTSWINNDQNYTLWDVSFTNTGSKTLINADIVIDYPLLSDCSALPGATCTNEVWNLSPVSTNTYHLPAWITDFGGLAAGSGFVFGVISVSNSVQFSAVGSC